MVQLDMLSILESFFSFLLLGDILRISSIFNSDEKVFDKSFSFFSVHLPYRYRPRLRIVQGLVKDGRLAFSRLWCHVRRGNGT